MPTSTRLSNGSQHCRIDWRPSWWPLAAVLLLTVAAPVAVLNSALVTAIAWPLALLALAAGIATFLRERRRPACVVVIRAGVGGGAMQTRVDGVPVDPARLQWRGPLAFLSWRTASGRRATLAWWPDTLGPVERRELRLASLAATATAHAPSMAP